MRNPATHFFFRSHYSLITDSPLYYHFDLPLYLFYSYSITYSLMYPLSTNSSSISYYLSIHHLSPIINLLTLYLSLVTTLSGSIFSGSSFSGSSFSISRSLSSFPSSLKVPALSVRWDATKTNENSTPTAAIPIPK